MRALVLLLVLPLAAGQATYELAISADDVPPTEPQEPGSLAIAWSITCVVGAGIGAPTTGSAELAFAINTTVHVAGATTHNPPLPDCLQTPSTTGEVEFQVTGDRDHPGLTDIPIHIASTLSWAQGPQSYTDAANTTAAMQLGFYPSLAAEAVQGLQQGSPGTTTTFEIEVENFGNAPIFVAINGTTPRVAAPAQWPTDALAAGAAHVLVIEYNHPSDGVWVNEEEVLWLELTPLLATDPDEKGEPVLVNIVARTRGGGDAATPAPALPLVVVALFALARRLR